MKSSLHQYTSVSGWDSVPDPSLDSAITLDFGLMKTTAVFHPSGVALRSRSVPNGFVTKNFAEERNDLAYSRMSKRLSGLKDQVAACPSGETCGLYPAPVPVIQLRNAA